MSMFDGLQLMPLDSVYLVAYAINHGLTQVALFKYVATVISLLAHFVGGSSSFLGISVSTLSSVKNGELKIALYAYGTMLLQEMF